MSNEATVLPEWPGQNWPELRCFSLFRSGGEDLARKRAAVEQLFETHYERVTRYIAIRVGNTGDAADLASEVFVRALRSVEMYQETGAPMEAWLFKIARNIAIDHLRQKARRPATPLDETLPLESRDDPVEDVERLQEIEELNQAMSHLTEAQQQILALRFGNEMTSEEVARLLGKKPGAIREMQSAAIKKLRDLLKSSAKGKS